jgi:GTPase SAR1 family protein
VRVTTPSPFQQAAATERRLKLFLWGDSGVGKKTLALRFPQPAVIDLEPPVLLEKRALVTTLVEEYIGENSSAKVRNRIPWDGYAAVPANGEDD